MALDIMFEQGASATEVPLEGLKAAKKAGCTVSYDLNYQKKFWPPADAKNIQEPMMADIDILITTEEDTNVGLALRRRIMRLLLRGQPKPTNVRLSGSL